MRPGALRDDLHDLRGGEPTDTALAGLVDALCAADRPESIIVWKRSAKVQDLLRALGDGTIPVSHEGLDTVPGKPRRHLRAILQHRGLLPQRDQYLPRFEQWINAKLADLPDEVGQPVRHFATWHHLRRIRAKAAAGAPTRGPVHSAKHRNGQVRALAPRNLLTHSGDLHPARHRRVAYKWTGIPMPNDSCTPG